MTARSLCRVIGTGLLLLCFFPAQAAECNHPDAVTPDGGRYCGPLVDGKLHGHGVIEWHGGERYEGQFSKGLMSGGGRLKTQTGETYEGEFYQGQMHGRGRLEYANGDVYQGEFKHHVFIEGAFTRKDGARYQGGFLKWAYHGKGRYTDAAGNVYEGKFVNGDLDGEGLLTGKNNSRYQGEFKQWRFHGQGTLHLPNGDFYKGGFAHGAYQGKGTLTYAKARPDGRTQDSGEWRYGSLHDKTKAQQALANTEIALYGQRRLLDTALASLAHRDPGKINLYLLAVAGDGSQDVFRREVEFVRQQFGELFGVQGRSLALINSRNTLATVPMATQTSIRESLNTIAARMDTDQDVLFFFLTSHGSEKHEFSIHQNSISLRGLPARDLAGMLKESGIRWKVVVVSACYSGGFIDAIKDEFTLVIAAARRDRQSFGCADDNDFTYFGRAYFKESLPGAESFEDAFRKAKTLIRSWEEKDHNAAENAGEKSYSFPQMHSPTPIRRHLQKWWGQQNDAR